MRVYKPSLALLAIMLLLLINPVQAQTPLKITYGLYAGGFNVVDIEGVYDISPKAYDLQMTLETIGLLGTLAPWKGEINGKGVNKGAHSVPRSYRFAASWRDETKTSLFTFGKDGSLENYQLINEDGKVDPHYPAAEVYGDKPVDMLTALFQAMNGESCEGTKPVMDYKRRFDMVFRQVGETVLEPSRYSVYGGAAEICEVEIVPVAGEWRDKPRGWMSIQEQARDQGKLPRIWFGKIRDDLPPVPVRFQIKTNYGTMIMHVKAIAEG